MLTIAMTSETVAFVQSLAQDMFRIIVQAEFTSDCLLKRVGSQAGKSSIRIYPKGNYLSKPIKQNF